MKKKVMSLLSLLLAFMLLLGCSATTTKQSEAPSQSSAENEAANNTDGTVLIGVSVNTLDSTMKTAADRYEQSIRAEGWEPILLNANGDVTAELANVESLINSGVKVVTIIGCDTEGSAASVKACSDAGIPCIIAGRKINVDEAYYTTCVAGDHYMAGPVQVKYINDYLDANPGEKMNLAFIYGASGNANVTARHAGFEDDCLKNPANAERVTLVAEQYAEFDAEKAYNITTDMLQTYCQIADTLGVDASLSQKERADEVVKRVCARVRTLEIPTDLSAYHVSRDDIDFLTESAFEVKRLLDQNPKPMTKADIRKIYETLFPA